MTISTNPTTRQSFTPSAESNEEFDLGSGFVTLGDESEIQVTVIDSDGEPSAQTRGADFNVDLDAKKVTWIGTSPDGTHTIDIRLWAKYQQPIDLTNSSFPPETLETQLDRVTILSAQIAENMGGKAFDFSNTDTVRLITGDEGKWDGEGKEAANFADPTAADSLATRDYVDQAITGSGDLPEPSSDQDGFSLRAKDGGFNVKPPLDMVVVTGDTSNRTTRAAAVSSAISRASTGSYTTVYVPDAFADYDASSVSFDSSIRMVREGQIADVYDVKAYGAAGDGSQDDTDAIEACIDAASQAGTGVIIKFSPADYVCGDLGQLSVHGSTTGGYTSTFGGSVEIHAHGATITHTGSGALFFLQGQPGADRVFRFFGGQLIADDSSNTTEALIKGRDLSGGCGLMPEGLEGTTSTEHLILLQNWYGWTENLTVTGFPLRLSAGIRQVRIQSASEASTYEGESDEGGTSSFARFRMFNVFTEGAQTHMLHVQGGAYDSFVGPMIGGNNDDADSIVRWEGAGGDSVVHGIHLEGGSSGKHVVDATGAPTVPTVWDVEWAGSDGVNGLSGNAQGVNYYFTPVFHEQIEVEGQATIAQLASVRKTGGDRITIADSATEAVVLASEITALDAMAVYVTTNDNSVRGHAIMWRNQADSNTSMNEIFTTGSISFGTSGGDLTVTNSTGSEINLSVLAIRAG